MPFADPHDPRRTASLARYNNSEKGRATAREWRAVNRERLREQSRTPQEHAWQKTARDRVRADPKKLEKKRAYAREWAKSDKGRACSVRAEMKSREWQGKGPYVPLTDEERKQRRRESLKRYAASGKARACQDRFYATPKGKALLQVSLERRRARLANAAGTFETDEWVAMLVAFDYHCAYCYRRGGLLCIEHVVSLAAGGRNDRSNIVPACRRCNAKKGNAHVVVACARVGVPIETFRSRRAYGLAKLAEMVPL